MFLKNTHDDKNKASKKVIYSDDSSCDIFSFSKLNSNRHLKMIDYM